MTMADASAAASAALRVIWAASRGKHQTGLEEGPGNDDLSRVGVGRDGVVGGRSTGGLPELTTRAVATRRECSQEDSLDKEGD